MKYFVIGSLLAAIYPRCIGYPYFKECVIDAKEKSIITNKEAIIVIYYK